MEANLLKLLTIMASLFLVFVEVGVLDDAAIELLHLVLVESWNALRIGVLHLKGNETLFLFDCDLTSLHNVFDVLKID